MDDKGHSAIVVTPELGGATPGGSGFARIVWGPADSTQVGDLYGTGLSLSGQDAYGSASVTFPGSDLKDLGKKPPIIELGLNAGSAGVSATVSHGMTVYQFVQLVKQIYNNFDEFSLKALEECLSSKS